MKSSCLLVLTLLAPTAAFAPPQVARCSSLTSLSAQLSRTEVLRNVVGVATAAASMTIRVPVAHADDVPSEVSIKVVKSGNGPTPTLGELAAIRFASYAGQTKIDDIFETPEPYYTRIGSGGLIRGVEDVLPKMRVGDRWVLTIPGKLAFGDKGRPASAGKPRIPANAEIVFDVEMVGLPGKEPELIELIGDV